MDNNQNGSNAQNNRLFLNFGNNDRFLPADRAYPTTPSTFPQPVFPQGQSQQGQYASQQQAPPAFTQGGYFMNNPYPPQSQSQYSSQTPARYGAEQQGTPQSGYAQRPNPVNDATNGLVHQFSHQNLGAAARTSPYGARQPSPSQRPRTAGAPAQQQGYSNYLNAPVPGLSPQHNGPEFQIAPERNPDRYGALTQNNQKRCAQLAADFFKDSVKRARDRNVR